VVLLTIGGPAIDAATSIESVTTRGRGVVKKLTLDGEPRGLAVSRDGVVYVGMANAQSIIAIDASSNTILREVVLDDPDIAATKEIVSLRIDGSGERLIAAHGSDESVTILSLPELAVLREITLEGERVRDAVADSRGRYLIILGREVRIFDYEGSREIRTLRGLDPMAIAVSDDGGLLAVVGSDQFPSGRASIVSLWDLATLSEISRDPLQTDRRITAATFADRGRTLIVASADWLGEKRLFSRSQGAAMQEDEEGRMRITFRFDDIVSSETICLADQSGPQALAVDRSGSIVYFPEKRCGSHGGLTGTRRRVQGAPLYAIDAYAIAVDPESGDLWATDRGGTVTLYRAPQPERR
jgi:DNA-binding beta-propeller fold protein YncE